MPVDDIPPARRRTRTDRLSEAPALLWLMLGALVVVGFVAFAEWGLGPPL